MKDLVDRLDFRGIVGATAKLTPSAKGWTYQEGERLYVFTLEPDSRIRGTLELYVGSVYGVSWVDLSVSACREEVAAFGAQGDAELGLSIRRDLFRFEMALRFAGINEDLLAGLEEDQGEDERFDLLIRHLPRAGRIKVAKLAKRFGGRVERRVK